MQDALDAPTLASLRRLDPTGQSQLMRRVLSTFHQSLVRLGQQVASDAAAAKLTQIRLTAHTLKSSSASIGALRLSGLCAALESAIVLGESDRLPGLLCELSLEIDRVDAAVLEHLDH